MEVLSYSEFKVTDEMFASKGKRFANYIIDIIIFYVLFAVFGIIAVLLVEITGSEEIINFILELENINPLIDRLITAILLAIFYMVLEGLTQRTVGKLITQTKVVLENGEKPSPETTMKRSLCRIIPFDAFSFLGNSSRGWHDTISKTYVVDTKVFEEHKKAFFDFKLLGK
jgi:uncharacterized RDD family membrane protein YckC